MTSVIPFPPKQKSAQDIEIETEQAIIGACFARPELLDQILEICEPQDFFYPPHDVVAQAILEARTNNQPITPLVIASQIATDADLIEAGGSAYLDAMRSAAPAGGVLTLSRNLVDLRLRRECTEACKATADALNTPGVAISAALQPIMDAVEQAAGTIGKRETVSIRDAADQMLRNATDRANGKSVVAATTGVQLLDETIGGLQGGDLIVYAGRPGMGKTALLVSTALRAAIEGRPVICFSLEMTRERLLQRVGCDLDYDEHPSKPLSYSWFRNGSAKHDDIARLGQALTRLPDNLRIVENGSLTIHEIAAMSRAFAAKYGQMGVVVIDYLQKVTAGDRYRGNRVQEVTEISGAAKSLAMRLGWPVVVGAQLNRGVESRGEKRPELTDLRESGSIEQDADAVVGLYRPAYYIEKRKPATGQADPGWAAWEGEWESEKNRLDLLVMKNRNGPEDSFSVFCDMRASAVRNERPRGSR